MAKSGHAGTPMALAPLAHVLFTRIMNYDVEAPDWPNRDRFVLSNGHASMLLYSYLYLTGVRARARRHRGVPAVGVAHAGPPRVPARGGHRGDHRPARSGHRQRGRARARGGEPARAVRTHGHRSPRLRDHGRRLPRRGREPRGLLARRPPRPGPARRDLRRQPHHDRRSRPSSRSPTTRCCASRAYGWHVIEVGEIANDLDALERAIREGMAEAERPSVVVLRSHIGWPSPKYTDTATAHGEAIGKDDGRGPRDQGDHRLRPGRALDRARRRARVLPRRRSAWPRRARGVGAAAGPSGPGRSRGSPRTTPPASSSAASTAGSPSSRRGRPATTRSRPAWRARRRSTRSPTSCPASSAAAPT